MSATVLKSVDTELDPPKRFGESRTIHAMTLDQLTGCLGTELNNVEKLETIIAGIENKFLTDEMVEQITDVKTLALVLDILSRRKTSSQNFLLKMLDLGMKSRLLSKLIDGAGPAPVGKVVKNQSAALNEMRAKLRLLADNKAGQIEAPPTTEDVDL